MSSIAAVVQAPLQEIRSQALATLFAALDAIEPIRAIRGGGQQSSLPPGQPFLATVATPLQNGRISLIVNGVALDLPVSPELEAEAAANLLLFRRGSQLALFADPAMRSVRIVLPDIQAPVSPATLNSIRASAPGPSADAPPPLLQVFANGTPGAALQRLTGLVFPVAEQSGLVAASSRPGEGTGLPVQGMLARANSGVALAMLPPNVAEAALQAAARQGPVSPAIAALLGSRASAATMPHDAEDALTRLSALRLDGTARPDAATIERALQQSGLFLEASLAKGQGAAHDIKSLLLALRSAFGVESTPAARAEPAPGPRQSVPAQMEASQPDLVRLIEGAVERIKVNQFASLPEHAGLRVTDERAQGFQVTTTIPLATHGLDRPQTAAIGLMIEHHPVEEATAPLDEDEAGREEIGGFPWKVRIALDLEATGPVQAEIALRGQAVAITLWAERRATAALARREIGVLHEALTNAAFDVTRLDVKDGRPSGPAMRTLPVLDRLT